MNSKPNPIGSDADAYMQKLGELSTLIFSVMVEFQRHNPELTNDLMMRSVAFDIGAWIAVKHRHWFRTDVTKTLHFYQELMRLGVDEGMKTWDQPDGVVQDGAESR
jgi:hypothetical protein